MMNRDLNDPPPPETTVDRRSAFEQLVVSICDVHGALTEHASKAVNNLLPEGMLAPSSPIRESVTPGLGLQVKSLAARLSFTKLAALSRASTEQSKPNPPIGILLCTQKDHALVQYALAGIDNQLFVSKYQLALPSKEDIRRFLEREIAESGISEDDSKTGRLVREMREKYLAELPVEQS